MGIAEFYKNKNILITGATGFAGQALVEKLLRSFPQINKIFILVRPKYGESFKKRTENYFNSQCFSKLPKRDLTSKIVWIESDLSQRLDIKLKEHINVIFHSAANVKLKSTLHNSIISNLVPTEKLLNFSNGCKNLDCFMYVSTSFINMPYNNAPIEERIYATKYTAKSLIEMTSLYGEEELQLMAPSILEGFPNVYMYTKCAAENLTWDHKNMFPVGIFRPSVLLHAYKEPFPYWMDSHIGLIYIINHLYQGHKYKVKNGVIMNCMPIDFAINGLIAAAYETANNFGKNNIYNTTNQNNPITTSNIARYYQEGINDKKLFLAPLRNLISSHFKDLLLSINGETPRHLKKIGKYNKHYKAIEGFLNNGLIWEHKNLDSLWNSMSEEEKKMLFFDINSINWRQYFGNMYRGTKYLREN